MGTNAGITTMMTMTSTVVGAETPIGGVGMTAGRNTRTAGRNTWGVSALRALLYDYIDKACTLASNLELLETPLPSMKDGQGNEALSGHDIQKATKPPSLVPVGTVFSLAFSTHCHQIATR
jgi:hypothetical protein